MMNTQFNQNEQDILDSWQEVYLRGQLTFWILLSISDCARYTDEIEIRISELTNGSIQAETKSVYRALRRFHDIEIVDYEMRESERGPDRKYYFLTESGRKIVREFIKQNIDTFYKSKVKEIINNV